MTDDDAAERLDVLSALLDLDPDASSQASAWVRADGSAADAALIDSATAEEWDLAAAVRGEAMNDADAYAIAALLGLADGSALAGALRIALREAFLDGDPADHAGAFAAAYRRLAAPGLDDEARERADRLLRHLGS